MTPHRCVHEGLAVFGAVDARLARQTLVRVWVISCGECAHPAPQRMGSSTFALGAGWHCRVDRAQLAAAAAVVEEVRQQALVARLHQALLLALVSVLRPRPQRRQPHQLRQRQPFRLFQQMPKATTR